MNKSTWIELNERLHANMPICECLSALESTQLLRLRQMDLFEKTTHCVGIRNSIGNHIVTVRADNIGPIILKNSQKQGCFSPNADWFWQYGRIESIWHDDVHLVYRTLILFTDRIQFLQYHFQAVRWSPSGKVSVLSGITCWYLVRYGRRNNVCAQGFSGNESANL